MRPWLAWAATWSGEVAKSSVSRPWLAVASIRVAVRASPSIRPWLADTVTSPPTRTSSTDAAELCARRPPTWSDTVTLSADDTSTYMSAGTSIV